MLVSQGVAWRNFQLGRNSGCKAQEGFIAGEKAEMGRPAERQRQEPRQEMMSPEIGASVGLTKKRGVCKTF